MKNILSSLLASGVMFIALADTKAALTTYNFTSTLGNGSVSFDASEFVLFNYMPGASYRSYLNNSGTISFNGSTYGGLDFTVLHVPGVVDGFEIVALTSGESVKLEAFSGINSGILSGMETTDLLKVMNSFDKLDGTISIYSGPLDMNPITGTIETFSAVPEPSTYLAGLSALGMLGLFGWRNRK